MRYGDIRKVIDGIQKDYRNMITSIKEMSCLFDGGELIVSCDDDELSYKLIYNQVTIEGKIKLIDIFNEVIDLIPNKLKIRNKVEDMIEEKIISEVPYSQLKPR